MNWEGGPALLGAPPGRLGPFGVPVYLAGKAATSGALDGAYGPPAPPLALRTLGE